MEDKINLYNKKKDCCACGACQNICPRHAISMSEDAYGFLYPEIDYKICIQCGLCKSVCSYQNIKESNIPLLTYAAVTKNSDILQSASGGVFSSFATSIIKEQGIIYGVSLENKDGILTPIHISAETTEELRKLQGSKYVQSYTGRTYCEARKHLQQGRLVLFSGTPCQIAGLKGFLKKGYDTLLTIEIICHGVPSARFFQDYIAQLGHQVGGKIIDFKFRDKQTGWGLTGKATYVTKSGKQKTKLIPCGTSFYYTLFLNSEIYRESCYSCPYACENRPGDLTIGDYWGIQKQHPEIMENNGGIFNERNGSSCMIVNTEKGMEFVEKYRDGLELYVSDFNKVAAENEQLKMASKRTGNREKILNEYKNYGYEKVEKNFREYVGIRYYMSILKCHFPRTLKRKIKSFLD
jgi:coenzyme F420-reducing hydrogenase beta subunit